jgi:hypothetical protein
MSNPVVSYCRAREELRTRSHQTHEERIENADAKRTLSDMLTESMCRCKLNCIEIPGLLSTTYLCVTTQSARHKPVNSTDDVLKVVDGVGHAVCSTPLKDIPDVVVAFVTQQLRSRRRASITEPIKHKLKVVAKPIPGKTVSISSTSNEVRQLSQQFLQVCERSKKSTNLLKPLREAQSKTEKCVLASLDDPVMVRMNKNGKEVNMRLLKCDRKKKKIGKPIGIRLLCSMCREVASRLVDGDHTDFEEQFKSELASLVKSHISRSETTRQYVKVLKIT